MWWFGACVRSFAWWATSTAVLAHGGSYRATVPIPPTWSPSVVAGAPFAAAHGGMYRGAAPTPVAPGSPGTLINQPLASGPNTRSAAGLDVSRWQAWWEFNKDAYLPVKQILAASRGPGLQPSQEQIDRQVVPALVKALRGTKQPDLASACLIALGKLAPDPAASGFRDAVVAALRGAVQEVRESAALALGITRQPWVLDDLLALFQDDARGRRLVDRERVDDRTRAFAGYALGLVAERSDDMKLRTRVIDVLAAALARGRDQDLELQLAAVHGLRLACPPSSLRSLEAWSAVQSATDALWKYSTNKRASKGEQLVQAHAMLAVAQAQAGDANAATRYLPRLLAEVAERPGQVAAMAQSAALAIGLLATPSDRAASQALQKAADNAEDRQVRAFALIALGHLASDDNREFLLQALARGHKATVRPWAALALGLMRHRATSASGAQASADKVVDKALLEGLLATKTTEVRGAYAIALGLAGHAGACKALREQFEDSDRVDEVAGYLALSLGMLGDQLARERLVAIAKKSQRRPMLMRQIGVALALLGDAEASGVLLDMIRGGDVNVATLAAVAGALGQVGDARALTQLVGVVEADRTPELARAFAAAAVGGIADDDARPWGASLSIGINYAAYLPTLTDGTNGVLDIL